jgi:hypothetical protein
MQDFRLVFAGLLLLDAKINRFPLDLHLIDTTEQVIGDGSEFHEKMELVSILGAEIPTWSVLVYVEAVRTYQGVPIHLDLLHHSSKLYI